MPSENADVSASSGNAPAFWVFVILGFFTAIGVFGLWIENDPGLVLTWFWTGLGVAVVYILYKIHADIRRLTNVA